MKLEIRNKSQSCEIVCALWNKWNNWIDIQNRNQIRHLKHQLQIQKNFLKKKILKKKIFVKKNFKKNFFFKNNFKNFSKKFFILKIEFVKLNFQMQQNICKNQIGTKKASFPCSPV